ncbi:MAG: leucine-rich repeat domain-containing protein, partial [Muribaculaceae bacterium]|nr:leucine-rich repeat domain-containing protein [Muribaculaceae bacterium]
MLRKPLLFLLTALGLTVPSVMSAFEYEGLNYAALDWEAGTCYLRSAGKVSGDLVIPAHPVDESGREWTLTKIGSHAFQECSFLTSLSLPEGVTSIGDYAFYRCSCLTSLSLP